MKTNSVPKIRFKGFTDDWEQRKLGEIAPLRGGFAFKSSEYGTEGVPIIRISNILSDGTVGADFVYYDEQEGDDIYSLYDGAAVLAMSGATTGKVSILHAEKGHKYYQNQRVGYFTPTENCDYRFVRTMVQSQLFIDQLASVLVAGAQPNVSSKEIDAFEFMIPKTKKEQYRIGEYIENLDHLITLHQRKCDETKELKKFMLQKMFPKKGEKKPEIRFEGFTDDWEQRKLVDVVDVRSGRDYKHLEEGDIPVYGTGGYMLSVNEALSEDEDAIGIGRKGTIDNPYILRAPFWTVDTLFYAVPRDKYDLNFVFDIFQNVNWKAKDESTGVPSLSKATINAVETLMPEYAEQKKIGDYFSNLDHLITLHQRKCDEIKEFKKFMLQNMFPQKG